MSETIVVGTDGSETAKRAVQEAVRLAKALEAELHVVAGFHPMHARISGAPEGAAKVWQPLPDSHVEATIGEAEAAVRLAGAKVKTHVVRGDPADALLSVARDVGASTIVVGNRGMRGGRRVLGSVPNTVSHKANCNVLIVQTDQK
jgi:nucleotide-binding universal stress UspA family protein